MEGKQNLKDILNIQNQKYQNEKQQTEKKKNKNGSN